jgi:hypothetical protein
MSQPCSAVELVLFDARGLTLPETRVAIDAVSELGVLSGVVLNCSDVATVVGASGIEERLGFWFGGEDGWPFERAAAFASVEPGRTLFVSDDAAARSDAERHGLQVHDPRSGGIEQRLP